MFVLSPYTSVWSFTVKSRDALDLPQFVFGAENKASRFSISRGEAKAKPADLRPGMGVPCHFENDGSVSYLLTPARPPPSRLAVQQWLAENPISGAQMHSSSRGERVFTMDANTGKLVPMDEAGSNSTTQDSLPGEEEFFRPASPKYDEKHVLATPMANGSQEYVVSSKRINRRTDAQKTSGSRSLYSNPPASVLPEVPPVQKSMAAPAPVDPRIAKVGPFFLVLSVVWRSCSSLPFTLLMELFPCRRSILQGLQKMFRKQHYAGVMYRRLQLLLH